MNHYQIGFPQDPSILPQQSGNSYHLSGDHLGRGLFPPENGDCDTGNAIFPTPNYGDLGLNEGLATSIPYCQSREYLVPTGVNVPTSRYDIWPTEHFAAINPGIGNYPASIPDFSTWPVDCSTALYRGDRQDYSLRSSFKVPFDGSSAWPVENFAAVNQGATNIVGRTNDLVPNGFTAQPMGAYPTSDRRQDWMSTLNPTASGPSYNGLSTNAHTYTNPFTSLQSNDTIGKAASVNSPDGQYPMGGPFMVNPGVQLPQETEVSNERIG